MMYISSKLRKNTINTSGHGDSSQIDRDQHFKINFFDDNQKTTDISISTDYKAISSQNFSIDEIQSILDQSLQNCNEFQQIKESQKLSDFSSIQKILKIIIAFTILLLIVYMSLNSERNPQQNQISKKNSEFYFQQMLDQKQMIIKNKEAISQIQNPNFLKQAISEDLELNEQDKKPQDIVYKDQEYNLDINLINQIQHRLTQNPVYLTDNYQKNIQKNIQIYDKNQIQNQLIKSQIIIQKIQKASNNVQSIQITTRLNQNLMINPQIQQNLNIEKSLSIQQKYIQQPIQIQDITDVEAQIQSNYKFQFPLNLKTEETFNIPFTPLSNQQNQSQKIKTNKLHHSYPSSKASIILQKQISSFSQVQQNEQIQSFKIITLQPKLPIQNSQIKKQNIEKIKLQKQQRERQIACHDYIFDRIGKYGWLYQFQIHTINLENFLTLIFLLINLLIKLVNKNIQRLLIFFNQFIIFPNGTLQVADSPCDSAKTLKQRLSEAMEKQHQRLDTIYQIDYYHKKQLRFCIVVNSYNNALRGLIYRNIDSILQQNYTNYHVVYTDDASTDNTGQKVKMYLSQRNSLNQRFKIKINQNKVGMMENIFFAVTQDCNSDEIVVMLDGDDPFIGTNVLSLLNAIYQRQKIAIMWNNYLQVIENNRVVLGISRDIDYYQKHDRSFRRTNKYLYSHLKSFYVELFRQIKVQDLQHEDGKFYGGASDTAMMFAMIEMAYPYYKYVPEIVYEYRYDTGQVGMIANKQAQFRALNKIDATTAYKELSNFSFIDRALQNALVF